MRRLFHGILLITTFSALNARTESALVRGSAIKDLVYVCSKTNEGKNCLYYLSLIDGKPKETIGVAFSIEEVTRWNIRYDKLWLNSRGRAAFFTDRLFRIDFPELLEGKLKWGPVPEGSPDSFVTGWGPIGNLGLFKATWLTFPLIAHYDYVPISPESVYLFLLRNANAGVEPTDEPAEGGKIIGDMKNPSWNFRVLKYDAKWGPNPLAKKHMTWIPGIWTKEQELEVAFKDSFHVFAAGSSYFFVTDGGKVYYSPKSTEKGLRKVHAIWDDKEKPVTHVISDVDKDKTYVVGNWPKGDHGEERKFIFALVDDQPKPEVFPVSRLKPIKAQEPLKSVWQFAHVAAAYEPRLKGRLQLEKDPKLQVFMDRPRALAEIDDLMRDLGRATGSQFALAKKVEHHRPLLTEGGISVPQKPRAFEVMQLLAQTQLVAGEWSKVDAGYLLSAEESTAEKAWAIKRAADEKAAQAAADAAAYAEKYPLRIDPRLKVSLKLTDPYLGLEKLLQELSKATGLTVALDDSLERHRPRLEIKTGEMPAWQLMEWLAEQDLRHGHWSKSEDGYRLVGESSALAALPTRRFWNLAGFILGGAAVLAAVVAVVLRVRRAS